MAYDFLYSLDFHELDDDKDRNSCRAIGELMMHAQYSYRMAIDQAIPLLLLYLSSRARRVPLLYGEVQSFQSQRGAAESHVRYCTPPLCIQLVCVCLKVSLNMLSRPCV